MKCLLCSVLQRVRSPSLQRHSSPNHWQNVTRFSLVSPCSLFYVLRSTHSIKVRPNYITPSITPYPYIIIAPTLYSLERIIFHNAKSSDLCISSIGIIESSFFVLEERHRRCFFNDFQTHVTRMAWNDDPLCTQKWKSVHDG